MEPTPPARKEFMKVAFVGLFTIAAFLSAMFYKRQDKTAQCQMQLRQLGLGLSFYMRDYDEQAPATGKWDVLMPYVKSSPIFNCPKVDNGYAMNRYLIRAHLSRISSPATVPAFYDAAAESANATDGGELWMQPGRHRGGSNVVFVDCRIKWMVQKPLFEPMSAPKSQLKKPQRLGH